MTILLGSIAPLYVIIFLGFLSGRFLDVSGKEISRFVIYIITPVVVFDAGAHVKLNLDVLTLPAFYFLLSVFVILAAYNLGKLFLKGSEANLFGCACFWKNTGYFGIPIALFLFPQEIANMYIIIIMGAYFVEITLGVYLLARHEMTPKDSVKKFLKIPSIYALGLGFLFNGLGYEIPTMFDDFFLSFKGAVTVMGMAIIGINIGHLKNFKIDFKLTSTILAFHLFIWPALVWLTLMLDQATLGLINQTYYSALMLIAVLPVGASVAIYASEMNVAPEKASTIVLISTLTGIITVPLVIEYFF